MNIKYRKANLEDTPLILDILNSASGDIEDIKAEQFLIAEDKNKIVGCVRIKNINNFLMLASLAVLPDYRKKGIGSALVTRVIGGNAKRPVYLFCNVKNKSFYEKFGFKTVKNGDIPENLRKDYNDLLNLKFAGNNKILTIMVLA